jgi:hypothetical protein
MSIEKIAVYESSHLVRESGIRQRDLEYTERIDDLIDAVRNPFKHCLIENLAVATYMSVGTMLLFGLEGLEISPAYYFFGFLATFPKAIVYRKEYRESLYRQIHE